MASSLFALTLKTQEKVVCLVPNVGHLWGLGQSWGLLEDTSERGISQIRSLGLVKKRSSAEPRPLSKIQVPGPTLESVLGS